MRSGGGSASSKSVCVGGLSTRRGGSARNTQAFSNCFIRVGDCYSKSLLRVLKNLMDCVPCLCDERLLLVYLFEGLGRERAEELQYGPCLESQRSYKQRVQYFIASLDSHQRTGQDRLELMPHCSAPFLLSFCPPS